MEKYNTIDAKKNGLLNCSWKKGALLGVPITVVSSFLLTYYGMQQFENCGKISQATAVTNQNNIETYGFDYDNGKEYEFEAFNQWQDDNDGGRRRRPDRPITNPNPNPNPKECKTFYDTKCCVSMATYNEDYAECIEKVEQKIIESAKAQIVGMFDKYGTKYADKYDPISINYNWETSDSWSKDFRNRRRLSEIETEDVSVEEVVSDSDKYGGYVYDYSSNKEEIVAENGDMLDYDYNYNYNYNSDNEMANIDEYNEGQYSNDLNIDNSYIDYNFDDDLNDYNYDFMKYDERSDYINNINDDNNDNDDNDEYFYDYFSSFKNDDDEEGRRRGIGIRRAGRSIRGGVDSAGRTVSRTATNVVNSILKKVSVGYYARIYLKEYRGLSTIRAQEGTTAVVEAVLSPEFKLEDQNTWIVVSRVSGTYNLIAGHSGLRYEANGGVKLQIGGDKVESKDTVTIRDEVYTRDLQGKGSYYCNISINLNTNEMNINGCVLNEDLDLKLASNGAIRSQQTNGNAVEWAYDTVAWINKNINKVINGAGWLVSQVTSWFGNQPSWHDWLSNQEIKHFKDVIEKTAQKYALQYGNYYAKKYTYTTIKF